MAHCRPWVLYGPLQSGKTHFSQPSGQQQTTATPKRIIQISNKIKSSGLKGQDWGQAPWDFFQRIFKVTVTTALTITADCVFMCLIF